MNGKMYWVLRKTIQNIVFRVKKVIYRLIDGATGISEYKSFRHMIIKYSLLEIAKGMLVSVVVLGVDRYCRCDSWFILFQCFDNLLYEICKRSEMYSKCISK